MPPSPTSAVHTAKKKGSSTRAILPAIPLAVALAGGALMHLGDTTASTVAKTRTTVSTMQQATTPVGTYAANTPYPLIAKGHPVDWWFVFKLNASVFPKCGDGDTRACPFGGTVQTTNYTFGQQYVVASSEAPTLVDGKKDCLGDTTNDPVGASFDEVYNGNFHYVVWNDQTYKDPAINGCSGDGCDGPWGHSKGLVAWNDAGEGFVMQVSTPSWPGSGSAKAPRKTDGNTLGCVKDDDVKVSQHFFALRLNHSDLKIVLKALGNSSVVTTVSNPQMVNNGGPSDVQSLVNQLGVKSASTTVEQETLSTGVQLISKPSDLNVPPWQMVSALLGGVPMRAATWWATPEILSTTESTTIGCWDSTLGKPGAVEIATSGTWEGKTFSLKGGISPNANHAKIGVSTSGAGHYAVFGDENQQGTLSGKCSSSQNGRGGMFFVVDNAALQASVTGLIAGDSAATQ